MTPLESGNDSWDHPVINNTPKSRRLIDAHFFDKQTATTLCSERTPNSAKTHPQST